MVVVAEPGVHYPVALAEDENACANVKGQQAFIFLVEDVRRVAFMEVRGCLTW